MIYRRWHVLAIVIGVIGVLMIVVGRMQNPNNTFLKVTGIVVFAAGLILIGIKRRCPKCRKMVPDLRKITHCPYCGEELNFKW